MLGDINNAKTNKSLARIILQKSQLRKMKITLDNRTKAVYNIYII